MTTLAMALSSGSKAASASNWSLRSSDGPRSSLSKISSSVLTDSATASRLIASSEPSIGVVADDDALDDLADEVLFVRYEAAGGFKLKPQLLVGASLGLVEDQLIGTDTECHGRAPALQAETDLATSTVRQQLGYDGLGRLVTATGPYGDYSYTYDGIGNRLSRTDTDGTPDETLSYLQNPHGHNSPLLASVQNGFVHPVTHDLEGNVTDDGIARYTIGPRNHVQEQLSLSGPTLRQYTYTADGLLAASLAGTDGPQRIFMRGLQGRLLAELIVPPGSDDPSQSTVYVWFGDRLLMTSDDLEYPAQQFVASNHIGFPIAAIGVDRQRWMVLWDGDHEPFGSVVGDTTNAPRLRYPGQWAEHPALEAHTPTSRSHFINGHRWYVPEWGRYSQSDPIGLEGGQNLFLYAFANPLRIVDPLGLYGTNDCSYYDRRCRESGGRYYCEVAPFWCDDFFEKYPDPDPDSDNDYEGWLRCVRKCLQDCDEDYWRERRKCLDSYPYGPDNPDPDFDNFWDDAHRACHVKCYTGCASWQWAVVGGDWSPEP